MLLNWNTTFFIMSKNEAYISKHIGTKSCKAHNFAPEQ